MKKRICSAMMIFIALSLCSRSSGFHAAELRPFVLPENQPPISQMEQRPVQRGFPAETPSVYVQFEKDVSRMDQEDRQRLSEHYRELRLQAYSDGDRVKMGYYDNLLNILNRYQ